MSIVLLCGDMMFMSRIAGAAKQIGVPCTTAMSPASLADKLVEGTRLVAIDLSTPGLEPAVLVPKIRTALKVRPRVIAFGPHVAGELLEEAETSGCDAVFSNGQFFANLPQLLSQCVAIAPESE